MSAEYPPGVVLEEIACPVDGSTQYSTVVEAEDIIYDVPGRFRVIKCARCGLMRTSPRPTLETIGVYYPSSYMPFVGTYVVQKKASVGVMKRILNRLINLKTSAIPPLPPGSLLEIGCASGSYLADMARKGWQVEGIEPSPEASAAARTAGFNVHTGAIETAPVKQAEYDLIVGWMVLEHLHIPIEALKSLHRMAKPGAWAVFSVPNAGSLEFRVFRQNWFALQLPTHTFHYTPDTIKSVLREGGWELTQIHHQRVLSNAFMSLGYFLRARRWNNGLTKFLIEFNKVSYSVHRILYPLAWLLSVFGQTGRMTVWARRIDD